MFKNNYFKMFIFIFAWEPVALKIHWFIQAWRTSPLDRFDLFFIVAALLMAGIFFKDFRQQAGDFDLGGIVPLVLSVAGIGLGIYLRINMIYMIFALLFCASMLWLLWGWRIFVRTLPLFLILMLALPATSFWCGDILQRLGFDASWGIAVKFIAAFILIAVELYLEYFTKLLLTRQSFFYFAAILFWIGSLVIFFEKSSQGDPFNLDISVEPAGKWLGESVELNAVEKGFYEGQVARRFTHYSDTGAPVSSLVVQVAGDIHKVHPFRLCLTSANWKILNSRRVELNSGNGTAVANCIEGEKAGRRYIFYVWYSSVKRSVDDFAFFRSTYSWDSQWTVYHVFTPVEYGNIQEAEQRIRNFVKTFFADTAKPVQAESTLSLHN